VHYRCNILAIYLAHRQELVNYAHGIVGDSARAEDVVQEAWMRLSVVAKDRSLDEPVGYVYRTVRNLAIDAYRRQRRENHVLDSDGGMLSASAVDSAPSPEAVASSKDDLRLLNEALSELPERTRIAVEMRRFGGYKLKEIADHLNISVTTAHDIIAVGIAHCMRRVRPGSSL